MKGHTENDSDPRNIPLSDEQIENLPEYINDYDEVLDVLTRKDGSTRIYLSKDIGDGHVIIVELVSKGRRSLQPVTAWMNSEERYELVWGQKKKAPNTSQTETGSEDSGYKGTLGFDDKSSPIDSINSEKKKVNSRPSNAADNSPDIVMGSIYNEGQDKKKFEQEFKLVWNWGKQGVPFNKVANKKNISCLTKEQRAAAHEAGKLATETQNFKNTSGGINNGRERSLGSFETESLSYEDTRAYGMGAGGYISENSKRGDRPGQGADHGRARENGQGYKKNSGPSFRKGISPIYGQSTAGKPIKPTTQEHFALMERAKRMGNTNVTLYEGGSPDGGQPAFYCLGDDSIHMSLSIEEYGDYDGLTLDGALIHEELHAAMLRAPEKFHSKRMVENIVETAIRESGYSTDEAYNIIQTMSDMYFLYLAYDEKTFIDSVYEEILCDFAGGMNFFSQSDARFSKMTEYVRQQLIEERVVPIGAFDEIDVSALNGTDASTDSDAERSLNGHGEDTADKPTDPTVKKALDMKSAGASPSQIFNATGLTVMPNGDITDGIGGPVIWSNTRNDIGNGAERAAVKNDSGVTTATAKANTVNSNLPPKLVEASKKYGEQADTMLAAYKPGQDVGKFIKAYDHAWQKGKLGASSSEAMNGNGYLTLPQRKVAYKSGSDFRKGIRGSETRAQIAEFAKKFGSHANEVRQAYKTGQNVPMFKKHFERAWAWGKADVPPDAALKSKTIGYLTHEQRQLAYDLGKEARAAEENIDRSAVDPEQDIENSENSDTLDLQSSFNKRIDSQEVFWPDYSRAIKEAYGKGTSLGKKVLSKFMQPGIVETTSFKKRSYFDNKTGKIYLNGIYDLVKAKRGNAVDFFHEFGHYIDFMAEGAKNGDYISARNTHFGEVLRADFERYVQKVMEENGGTREGAEEIISKELMYERKHGISDMFEGLANGTIKGCVGHVSVNPHYWKTSGRIEREAFAHMFQSLFERESMRYMSEYFPEAFKEFKKMLKELT